MHFHVLLYRVLQLLRVSVLPLVIITVTASLGVLFHIRGQRVVEDQLRERMLSNVALAALHMDGDLVERIRGPEDADSAAYHTLVQDLKNIRFYSPHVRFAYVMRRTDDSDSLMFVADADALSTVDELDVNRNGMVDINEEPAFPGDAYPIEGIEELHNRAFIEPVVDDEITEDQWGILISAYAPVRNSKGKVVGILGIDITSDDFFALTNETFSLIAVLLVTLIGALLAAYILIIVHARNEESVRRLESERTALYDLATHQLGMPLATFRWWLEILREKDNGKFCENDGICDQLQQGIDRLDSIIMALHDAGNLPGTILQYTPVAVPIPAAINKTLKDLQPIVETYAPTIEMEMERNLPKAKVDKKLFHKVLRELLENAITYSPHGGTITIRARRVRKGVNIVIEDHGCGIPTAELRHMGEKFRRASNASRVKPVGNGFGLYVVKRIVETAGGTFNIVSALNKGTSVSLTLPAA